MTSADRPQLISLAAELEREGQYNIAKLLRAAAESMTRREGFDTPPARAVADQAAELRQIAEAIADTPAGALSESLHRGAAALEDGRVAFIDETPDPRVCRTCGVVRNEPFELRCTHCGAWPSTALRVRPIYWMTETGPEESIDRLRVAPVSMERMLEGHDHTDLVTQQKPGDWSAHQVIEHLHFAQGVLRGRLDLLLAGGNPDLASAEVWKMEGDVDDTRALFAAYQALRGEIVGILEGVPADAWWNTGDHQEWGVVTLLEQVSYFANHEPTHLSQLEDALPAGS